MIAQDIVIRPIITEKAMQDITAKKYVFEVAKKATKIDVARAVEELFKVKVEKVTTINYNGKPKRMGVHSGKRADWKKAVVKLTPDSKTIELFES